MNRAVLEQFLAGHDMADMALLRHGFAPHLRDYHLVVFDPRANPTEPTRNARFEFKYCVAADVTTKLSPETWCRSLDDRLLSTAESEGVDGYVWGVNWQCIYPNAIVVTDSERASEWTHSTGRDFHEVLVETNCQVIKLVFSDFSVAALDVASSPFSVDTTEGG